MTGPSILLPYTAHSVQQYRFPKGRSKRSSGCTACRKYRPIQACRVWPHSHRLDSQTCCLRSCLLRSTRQPHQGIMIDTSFMLKYD